MSGMQTMQMKEMRIEHEDAAEELHAIWRHRGAALMLADFVLIVAGFLLAFCARSLLQRVLMQHVSPYVIVRYVTWGEVESYLKGALLLATVWVVLIWRAGGYEGGLRGIASPMIRIRLVLVAGAKAFAILMVISYMYRGSLLSRPVYVMTALLSLGSLVLVRLLFLALDRDLAAQGLALQKVLLAGLDPLTEGFARRLAETGSTVRLAGFLTADGAAQPDSFAGYPILGRLDGIQDVFDRQPFEKLVLSHSVVAAMGNEKAAERMIEIVNFCESNAVSLYALPNAMSVAVAQNEVGTFSGMPLVKLRDAALHGGYAVVKRVMDLFLAGTVLILGSPIWVAIAVAIKCTSKGPVIFSQTRVGLYGRRFKMYKFRSMVANAEARLKDLVDIEKLIVPGFKLKGDPRVTRIGRFLRRTSLDEIPQLLNVIKGEMSVIGPRPEMPDLVDRYNPWQQRRLKAKPGITGYQQVMARGQPLAGAIKYDLVYLKHQSFLLDLYILLKTVVVVLRGSGVTH